MRKALSVLILFLFIITGVYAQEQEIEIPFENGVAFIPQIDGEDDLNSVRIEYNDGFIFFGVGTEDGFPIYGTLSNSVKKIFYTGALDENENYTGDAVLETPDFLYEGNFKDGKKNGYGILFDKKTHKTYEGNFLNDKKNGKGTEYNSDLNYYYEGNWENGLYQGFGFLISDTGTQFEGQFEKGEIKGFGTKTNSNGEVLKGDWKNSDLLSGEDCTYLSNGKTKYSGSIVDGKFEGAGIYTDETGTTYEGSFSGNQRTGLGQQVYPDGSVYTGYYFGNQRNGLGSFSFSNGMEYEGGFLDGAFYGTGYLSAEENEEITIIASDDWDGLSIPDNSDGATTSDGGPLFASVKLPKTGKILFSNGDMWEGYMSNGMPVAGLGIWTTQEERLARMDKQDSHVVLASYKLNDKTYDLSSVYDDYEVYQIIHSDTYLVGFNDFYKKHKGTIDKVIIGLQVVSAVLTIVPNPIQPIAPFIDIGLSAVQISLKTISSSMDVYDACIAGNKNLIPGMLKDYGKDIVWDAVNIIFAIPGSGKLIGKLGSKAAEGMGKAGKTISQNVGKVVAKNPALKQAATHLGQLGKVGKGAGKALVEAAGKSKFFKFVAKNGGKLTKAVKTGWIKAVYPKLFAKYGDDATRLLFKYGNDVAEQLGKNGDVIVKAARANGDDVVRLFLKNGDHIATVARASEYPEAIVRYINNCANTDDAIRIASKYSSLGKIVNKYGDEAIAIIEKYGDEAISIIEKNDDLFFRGIRKVSQEQYSSYIKVLKNHPEYTSVICNNDTGKILTLVRKAGVDNEAYILNAIKKGGNEAVNILNSVPKNDFIRTVNFLDVFDVTRYKTIAKNGLPQEITSQVIQDSRDIPFLHDSINGKLRNANTGEIVSYVKHEERYITGQELKTNIAYRTGEGNYYYKTDELGRLSGCETNNLRLQEDIRNTEKYVRDPHNSNTPNKKTTDDAGHVIAGRFGGSGELDNLISQNSNLNKSAWKKMENNWVNELRKGNKVQVKIDIKYADSSKRPSEFIVTQIINGKVQILNFLNI